MREREDSHEAPGVPVRQGRLPAAHARDGKRMLVDGGCAALAPHVAPALGASRRRASELDLVYVSPHRPGPHRGGPGAHGRRGRLARARLPAPRRQRRLPRAGGPRPPAVARVWHNAFHDQVGRNKGTIDDALGRSSAAALDGRRRTTRCSRRRCSASWLRAPARAPAHTARPDQLGIPVNREFGGKLAMVAPRAAVVLGSLGSRVLGPFEEDLEELREEWNDWLAENGEPVERLRPGCRRTRSGCDGGIEAFVPDLAVARTSSAGARTSANLAR